MASHFSSIGLSVDSEQDMVELARRIGPLAEGLAAPGGTYFRWFDPSGVELWLQLNDADEVIGMNPHFLGESEVLVGLTARVDSSNPSELDGAFRGWAEPSSNEPESGCYPFVFDAPDFRLHDELVLPVTVEVQVAAFAHEVKSFESVKAYGASQTAEVRFASQSFIPSGLFNLDGETPVPSAAQAIFTGHVLKTERRTNTLTGGQFFWALVETLGGRYDVVIDPALLPKPPRAGGVLSGMFWITGRIQGG